MQFASGITAAVGTCCLMGGSAATATMTVGSLIACGPAGWAILGVGAVVGTATGFATANAW